MRELCACAPAVRAPRTTNAARPYGGDIQRSFGLTRYRLSKPPRAPRPGNLERLRAPATLGVSCSMLTGSSGSSSPFSRSWGWRLPAPTTGWSARGTVSARPGRAPTSSSRGTPISSPTSSRRCAGMPRAFGGITGVLPRPPHPRPHHRRLDRLLLAPCEQGAAGGLPGPRAPPRRPLLPDGFPRPRAPVRTALPHAPARVAAVRLQRHRRCLQRPTDVSLRPPPREPLDAPRETGPHLPLPRARHGPWSHGGAPGALRRQGGGGHLRVRRHRLRIGRVQPQVPRGGRGSEVG